MQGAPSGGIKIEIEFVAGTWTDVSTDFDNTTDIVITWGQTSEFSAPQVTTMSLKLDNVLGKYTPQRPVLADGTTTNPYYPNIQKWKRIRVSYTTATSTYVRFFGYIKQWQPIPAVGETSAKCAIAAVSRDYSLSTVPMLSPIAQEAKMDSPVAYWQLDDAAGSTVATSAFANGAQCQVIDATAALTFGATGPNPADGTAVKFAPSSASAGQTLVSNAPIAIGAAFTMSVWVNAGTTLPSWATSGGTEIICGIEDSGGGTHAIFYLFNGQPSYEDAADNVNGSTSIADGQWHHIAATRTTTGGPVTLYVDGVSVGATTTSFPSTITPTSLRIGDAPAGTYGSARFQGSVAQLEFYNTALSATRIAAHSAAGKQYAGDTTGQRIARYLGYAGLTSTDWLLDAGQCVVGAYPQAGANVWPACQAMAESEGQGSAVFVNSSGVVRFEDRSYRPSHTTPVMTLDAAADIDGSTFAPSLDDSNTVTQSAVSNNGATYTYTSPGATNIVGDQVTSYALVPNDAAQLAQSRVSEQSGSCVRLQEFTVDLYTASTAGLYDALPLIEDGSRVRVTNLPKWMPTTQLDLYVEGATETLNVDKYTVAFATSPADAPAKGIWDSATYGRAQAAGNTLNAARTASATTLTIATAAGNATFTTNSAMYPMTIQIDQEVISLNSAPGTSTSPQSFTGISRGQQGTIAAAHAAGAVITVWPRITWTL